ncbi:hypothetical protein RFI_30915 [Reticulomyxa filosa]|uniref:Palmitoyltransferase n=1 Tax=Reticulomyxa filosa TaxID=46433 RepID=X6LYQ8_RETFI|nr:hypothetical protein RFI_30915 [Reticulomyxa filosa]|eukprot:ETO06476.1 hypothetical protein RFI_30915 [Reticulomyxa filosa]
MKLIKWLRNILNYRKFNCRRRALFSLKCCLVCKKPTKRGCNCLNGSIDKGTASLGPCLAIIAVLLILIVSFQYIIQIHPHLVRETSLSTAINVTGVFLWLFVSVLFNHQSCVWISPGYAPKCTDGYSSKYQNVPDEYFKYDPELKNDETVRYCKQCQTEKPWRAHHCRVCNRCILRMDHHCPWIWNCVGFRNQRYFYMFLFYLWVGTFFFIYFGYNRLFELYKVSSCILTFLPTIFCKLEENKIVVMNDNSLSWFNGRRYNDENQWFMFCYYACCGVNAVMLTFLMWNSFLLVNNQTTLESFQNLNAEMRKTRKNKKLRHFKYLYDLGSAQLNIQQVFGSKYYLALLPICYAPIGNGLLFPLRDQVHQIVFADTTNEPPNTKHLKVVTV